MSDSQTYINSSNNSCNGNSDSYIAKSRYLAIGKRTSQNKVNFSNLNYLEHSTYNDIPLAGHMRL